MQLLRSYFFYCDIIVLKTSFLLHGSCVASVECFQNEETLKKCVTDYQHKLKKQEDRYQALKAHAEEKLEL